MSIGYMKRLSFRTAKGLSKVEYERARDFGWLRSGLSERVWYIDGDGREWVAADATVERWMTVKEYCAATGCSPGPLRRYLRDGLVRAGPSGRVAFLHRHLGRGIHPEANHGTWYLPEDCVLPELPVGGRPEGWLTLREYCAQKGRSFSTIRRYLEIGAVRAGPSGLLPALKERGVSKVEWRHPPKIWYLPADCIAPDRLPPGRPRKQLREPIDAA